MSPLSVSLYWLVYVTDQFLLGPIEYWSCSLVFMYYMFLYHNKHKFYYTHM